MYRLLLVMKQLCPCRDKQTVLFHTTPFVIKEEISTFTLTNFHRASSNLVEEPE